MVESDVPAGTDNTFNEYISCAAVPFPSFCQLF